MRLFDTLPAGTKGLRELNICETKTCEKKVCGLDLEKSWKDCQWADFYSIYLFMDFILLWHLIT